MDDVKGIIEDLLERMNLPHKGVEKNTTEVAGYVRYEIVTDDPGLFIGKSGAHLKALSTVVRKILRSKTDEKDTDTPAFFIDVGDYETNKIQEIQRIAYTMAGRAKTFERNIELDPMSAYERMIIHNTLDDDPQVTTRSTGKGKERRVVVYYTQNE